MRPQEGKAPLFEFLRKPAATGPAATDYERAFADTYSTYWRGLVIANIIVIAAYATDHILHDPYAITYIHLLVDYHFGLMKRALVGEIVSLFTYKVPPLLVFIISGALLVLTILLYVKLFQRTFGFTNTTAPLLVFIAGSPFFFKHFVKTMGYFDIFGCLFAIILLLAPTSSFGFVVFAALSAITLIFIHHIHMLLFIPTIAAIVIIRYYLARPTSRGELVSGVTLATIVTATFIAIQFFGSVRATPGEFETYLTSRMDGGLSSAKILDFSGIWFRTFSEEVRSTWRLMPSLLRDFWIYVILFVLSTPLIRYGRDTLRAISSRPTRRIVYILMTIITLGYVAIFATVFDYARWVSGWVVCMILMLHAAKNLPGTESVQPIPANNKMIFFAACILTAIPKMGIIRPYD